MIPHLSLGELLQWERTELARWEQLFTEHPDALEWPFATEDDSDPRLAQVRGVVHHIAAVEHRYVDRLEGKEATPYHAIPSTPDRALFGAAREANARLLAWVELATDAELARVHEFTTISAGTIRASGRKIASHAVLHGIRHWAQLATALRMHGLPTGWHHDLLMSDALE